MLACDSHVLDTRLTRVLVLEFGHIVDVLINDDPWAVALAMQRDIVFGEDLGHDVRYAEREKKVYGELGVSSGEEKRGKK